MLRMYQAGTQRDYGPAGHISEALIPEALGSSPINEYLYTALISEALAVILELCVYCPAGDAAEAACLLSRRTHLSQRRITSRRENQKKN